jgi:ABC-type amino acid transport substrate-binding protein/mono/diheme cytochrome c family protein
MTFSSCSICQIGRSLGLTLVIAVVASAMFLGLRPAPTAAPGPGGSAIDGTLRACVLSHDMPLSTERPDEYSGKTGLYLDLAKVMAQRQNANLQSHFAVTAFYKRPVREGLLANKCDAYFGLPRTNGPWFIRNKVALTKSFTSIGYALAVPTGETVSGLADLKGKTVAVQGGSPGAIAVSYMEGINTMTYRYATPALEALEAGEVDAALVWGPKAGYYVKHVSPGAFDVHATTLEWPVAIGVRAEDRSAMVPALESLIDQTAATVAELRAEYGLPNGEPIQIELRGPTTEGDSYGDASTEEANNGVGSHGNASTTSIGKSSTPIVQATLLDHVPYASTDTTSADIENGARLFNSTYGCAHCHGTDAMGATMGTNLRTMEQRYGDEAEAMFLKTVREGRDGTAMPPWQGVISEDKIEDIRAFIFSLQEEE